MKIVELHRKLIAAARANPPSDQVPYAFEKRIMACLTGRPAFDALAFWGRALWRAAVSSLAVVLVVSVWMLFTAPPEPSSADLSQDFENTLLAAVDQF